MINDLEQANARLKELCEANGLEYCYEPRLVIANRAIEAIQQGKLAWAVATMTRNMVVTNKNQTTL